ncbi:mucin-2 isoform X9 [Lates calcarifer]|uniref:Mucin-2 isoform X9 n=1 Tax=Lates calcarifer TaxID=8187 RepID=A0AAJ8B4E8_LATCA|nr:mucin-2 isoform X9 [Lates calcarifer]
MRVNIYMLAVVLSCNVRAEIIYEAAEERRSVTLHCPHPVEDRLTWSRETDGNKVDILTADSDRDIRYNDPGRRYSTLVDRSLSISRAVVSDSGKYFCNNKSAVELTVIPSGTPRLSVMRRTNSSLQCSPGVGGSGVPTWSREIAGKQQQMSRRVSTEDKTLTVTRVQPDDSGLYYCDGKPAAYLTVTEGEKPERERKNITPSTTTTTTTPTTTTTTTPTTTMTTTTTTPTPTTTTTTTTTTPTTTTTTTTTMTTLKTTQPITTTTAPDGPRTDLGMVVGISAPVLLLVLLFIIYFTRRRRLKRRENEERGPVYEEILEGSVCQPLNGITSTYCMVTFPAGSHQNDPTYATISDLPLTATMTGSQLANTYSLLEKPKAAGNNNNDQYL